MPPQTSTPCATMAADDQVFVLTEREGLQLDRRCNLIQLAAVVASAGTSAAIGFVVTEDHPEIGALAGGILGMIAGTFVSGFVLMLLPAPTAVMTLGQMRAKYRRIKRRLLISGVLFAGVVLSSPFIIGRFGNDDSNVAWIVTTLWMSGWMGLCAYTKMLVYRLREWKCPACVEPLWRSPPSCAKCGLSMDSDQVS